MFKSNKCKIKLLKSKDKDFTFSPDGITLVPRASIEISELCPTSMKLMIHRAIADGYLTPVAYMKESEYVWEQLGGTV